MSGTVERLMRRVEAIDTAAGENRARTENHRRVTEELAHVTGTASSPDGVVTVVAGPDGAVEEITFSERVGTVAPSALSASVLHTIARARFAAARQQAEVLRRGLDDTDLLDRVLAEDERLFGDRLPADPGPPPPAEAPGGPARSRTPGGRDEGTDEDLADFRVLGR